MGSSDHAGHRERMRTRYINDGGFDNFEEHQILEMLLFYAIPRRDTNELAHKILNEFGSLDMLINAPPEAVASRTGISLNAAVLISMVGKIQTRSMLKKRVGVKLDTVEKMKEYCYELLKNKAFEVFYIICMDKKMRVISPIELAKGSEMQVGVKISSMMSGINVMGASFAVCAHNHPTGMDEFSIDDIKSTMIMQKTLKLHGVKLTDHILVCGEKAVSMAENKKYTF